MRLFEIEQPRPHLYLDMDGVQADFFTQWASWHAKKFNDPQIRRYKDIGDDASREASIMELTNQGPEFVKEFFATLPVLPHFKELLSWFSKNNVPFTVLSAPLRGNHEASIAGKKIWLDKHNPGASKNAIFTGMKEKYAVTNGQPNVLVDDHKKYIERWQAKGGIGVLHRDENVANTIATLNKIYKTNTLDKPTHGIPEIAKKFNVTPDSLVPELQKGIKVELEHTSDVRTAIEIALDHLWEKPNYYSLLGKYIEK